MKRKEVERTDAGAVICNSPDSPPTVSNRAAEA